MLIIKSLRADWIQVQHEVPKIPLENLNVETSARSIMCLKKTMDVPKSQFCEMPTTCVGDWFLNCLLIKFEWLDFQTIWNNSFQMTDDTSSKFLNKHDKKQPNGETPRRGNDWNQTNPGAERGGNRWKEFCPASRKGKELANTNWIQWLSSIKESFGLWLKVCLKGGVDTIHLAKGNSEFTVALRCTCTHLLLVVDAAELDQKWWLDGVLVERHSLSMCFNHVMQCDACSWRWFRLFSLREALTKGFEWFHVSALNAWKGWGLMMSVSYHSNGLSTSLTGILAQIEHYYHSIMMIVTVMMLCLWLCLCTWWWG